MTRKLLLAAVVGVLLAGCTPTATTSPSTAAVPSTATPTPTVTATPTPTATATPTPASNEDQIRKLIIDMNLWLDRMYASTTADPTKEGPLYLADDDPDYLRSAIYKQIWKEQDAGHYSTGAMKVVITSVTPLPDNRYMAKVCEDGSGGYTYDKDGKVISGGGGKNVGLDLTVVRVPAGWRIWRITSHGEGSCTSF